ncbi:MAG: ABC transporter substrate-binding protein [Oscillospiraceae bacterium]|nr:ABC transporter substrate-binding protein [Oscillospiraceae bacterium]
MKKKIIALILTATAFMLLFVPACQDAAEKPDTGKDREGNPITLPEKIEKIISIGPSNAEVLVALGAGDKIIAVDAYSGDVEGLKAGIPLLPSITEIDGEFVIDLQPDVIFVTGMSKVRGENPFQVVEDTGICVIVIPSSVSVDGIKEDIRYMAAVLGVQSKGSAIISDFQKEIDAIKKIGETITDKKSVYFEVGQMYSLGKNTFIDEMIKLIGANNIFADQESWIAASEESVLAADPDVILTTTNYIDDPLGEIKARPGWDSVTAIKLGAVYYIDTDSSNRPNHNVVKALKEMALAVYPDEYSSIK